MIGIQDERGMSQASKVRTVRELSCTLCPGARVLALARSFLLNIVTSVQFAVEAIRTGLRVSEAGPTSSINRSRRGSHDIAVTVRVSAIAVTSTRSGVPIRDRVRIRVSPKCSRIKLHAGSHVHVMLPSLFRKCLRPNHRKRGSKRNVCGPIRVVRRSGRRSRSHARSDSSN